MTLRPANRVLALSVLALAMTASAPRWLAAQANGLHIVVIEGENAVNIIQQRTAVAPVVEVRDRNDQPVAGALVRFAIQGNRANFVGARTLTITTDASGRAVAAGLTPTANGTLRITASAAFQGQTAAATIVQTNVLTAAQAASVSGAAAGAGAGASGAGTGLSNAALIGIAGAGAAGGVFAIAAATGEDPPIALAGDYSVQYGMAFVTSLAGGAVTCTHTRGLAGALNFTIREESGGAVSGTIDTTSSETIVAVSPTCNAAVLGIVSTQRWTGTVTGTTNSLAFTSTQPYTSVPQSGGSVSGARTLSFSGSLAGGVVTGTLSLADTATGTTLGVPLVWQGNASTAVTAR